jgi:hypothetical protein
MQRLHDGILPFPSAQTDVFALPPALRRFHELQTMCHCADALF